MGHFLFRMSDLYLKKVKELSKISQFKLIIFTVLIEISVTLIFSFLLFPNHNAGPTFDSKLEEFFIAVIFAPILETLIFQYSIISYILDKRPNAYLFTCIFSATLFALSHFYSPEYILKTFFSGLLFGTLYLVVQNKNNYAFFIVAIAHSIYNFIGFCLRQI